MERYLKENFEVDSKNPSEEALRRWRSVVSVVKNPRRRFRMVADLSKRYEAEKKKQNIQEKIEIALAVQRAALQFLDSGDRYSLPEEVRQAGFDIDPDYLASMVYFHDTHLLRKFGGIEGIARCLSVSLDKGISVVNRPPIHLRQKIYGVNKYNESPSKGFWLFVWEALQDTTLLILIFCALLSMGLGVAISRVLTGLYEGLGIILCIFLVVMVTAISDYKQSLQFRDLTKETKKIFAWVTREGNKRKVSIYDLLVGDVVHLYPGDQVPADGIFISGYDLLIDQSCLTGESDPVDINSESPFLLSGTKVQDGSGKMLVAAVGMRTEWGKLMETSSKGGDDETPLQVKLNGVATIVGKIGLAISILIFVVLTARFLVEKALHNNFHEWSYSDALKLLNNISIAVTIMVAAVPEGLPLAVTLSLGFSMRSLMNERALVRHLSACETMGSVSCICADKTGTLTTNQMEVDKIWICANIIKVNESKDVFRSAIPGRVLQILFLSITVNSSSEVVEGKDGKKTILGTPTESALLEFCLPFGIDPNVQRLESKIVDVEPFNSIKKKMSVLIALPAGGWQAFSKGAAEIILPMCEKIINHNGESVSLSEEFRKNVMDIVNEFSSEAMRTICFAVKDIAEKISEAKIPGDGYTLVAIVGIKDPVRPGVKNAVQTCLAAGISVRMVTGDNINTAIAIAKECGILTDSGLAIEGPSFSSKSAQEMKELIPKIQVIARSSPSDKHTLVTQLKNMFGELVAVTGDGTNDAPALKDADIGLAMGIAGTEVAKENADVIIMDDNFTTIVNLVKRGRGVYLNIQKFSQFQLTVNVVALMLNLISVCVSGSAPFSTFQLLWISMIMDILGALALATEPPSDSVLQRPPVGRGANFFTTSMRRNIVTQSVYQLAVLTILKFNGHKLLKLQGPDASHVLNTIIFNTFVFCQVFNEINSREMEKVNVFRGISESRLFLLVIVSIVIFQVAIVEFLGILADTVPLNWQFWLLSILLGSGTMVIATVTKCLRPANTEKTVNIDRDGYILLPSGPELA